MTKTVIFIFWEIRPFVLVVLMWYLVFVLFLVQVALEHVNADMVVHFGDACMSLVQDIPVYYAFENELLDIDFCTDIIRERFGGMTSPIYLGYDLSFARNIDALVDSLLPYCPTLIKGEVMRSQNLSNSVRFDSHYIKMGYHYFKIDEIDPSGVVLFIARDGTVISNYHENGNLYSMMIDSTYTKATVLCDSQLQNAVFSFRSVDFLDLKQVLNATLCEHRAI